MWSLRRRIIYALAFITAVIAGGVFTLKDTIFPSPTCFDTKQNGYEIGIDCGGTCALRCREEVRPLTVDWSKAVPLGGGLYDFVGMVRNENINNASKVLSYTFTSYNDQGVVSSQLTGQTVAPIDGTFPVIIQNIPLKSAPTKVALDLVDGSHYTVKESPTSPTVRTLERRYEVGSIPRVYARIMNTKRIEINNLPIRAVLFDDHDNAYAVGQTIIPYLGKEEVKEITFTWNSPLPFAPTRIEIYPIFNPFEAIGY